ncbi:MAG: T9SS type A sorting domain-containing protein [Calditrichia bacterium]
MPTVFSLEQNYPNPFNPSTTLKYALPTNADVRLEIYNVLGQLVKVLVDADQTAGFKTAIWDGTNQYGEKVASGIYIYRIKAADFVQSKKMILMK